MQWEGTTPRPRATVSCANDDDSAYTSDISPVSNHDNNRPSHAATAGPNPTTASNLSAMNPPPPTSFFFQHEEQHHPPIARIRRRRIPLTIVVWYCLSEPRTATMVHGETGHIATCLACARIIKARGDACPICRLPIDLVITHYYV